MKIYVTRSIPEPGISMLKKAGHKVSVYPGTEAIPRATLLKNVKGVDAILALLTDKIDAEVMDTAGKQLKIISNYAVGVDNINVPEAKKRNILVSNTPGVLTESVAELTFALLISSAKRIAEADKFTRAGKYQGWGPKLMLGADLKDATLGIVGLGRIGSRVAEMAVCGMGMKVVYNDVKPNKDFEKQLGAKFLKLDALLKQADFVSIHVPLLPTTRHLIGEKQLKMMKKTAYLINTSRGPIIDEKALVKALKSKQIAGAGLDVFEFEPKLAPGLEKLDNVTLTPHIASGSIHTRSEMSRIAAQNILDALSGKKPKFLI